MLEELKMKEVHKNWMAWGGCIKFDFMGFLCRYSFGLWIKWITNKDSCGDPNLFGVFVFVLVYEGGSHRNW